MFSHLINIFAVSINEYIINNWNKNRTNNE